MADNISSVGNPTATPVTSDLGSSVTIGSSSSTTPGVSTPAAPAPMSTQPAQSTQSAPTPAPTPTPAPAPAATPAPAAAPAAPTPSAPSAADTAAKDQLTSEAKAIATTGSATPSVPVGPITPNPTLPAGYGNDLNGKIFKLPNTTPAPFLSADAKTAINQVLNPPTTGVITTDSTRSALAAVGNAVQNYTAPTPLSSTTTDTRQYISNDGGNTWVPNPNYGQTQDSINASLPPELQALDGQVAKAAAEAADPTKNATYQAMVAARAEMQQASALKQQDIQSTAARLTDQQTQLNKEALARMRVALAGSMLTASPTGEAMLRATIDANQKALDDIAFQAQIAVNEAQAAFLQQDAQMALGMAQQADSLQNNYNSLLVQNFQMKQTYQTSLIQRQAAQQQVTLQAQEITKNGISTATDLLAPLAKQMIDPANIPDAVWQQASQAAGTSPTTGQPLVTVGMAKAIYAGSLKDAQATNAASFNANTQSFYQLAAQIPLGSNVTLNRPNPDGTYSTVTFNGGRFLAENGQSYRLVQDANDPTAAPIKIPLGAYSPNTSLQQDAFGNTNAITLNPDGSITTKQVLDFAGNPVGGQQAVTGTIQHLDSTGTSYVQTSGQPSWTQQFPDGSVHTRANGTVAPECGQFVNDILGTKFGDSLKDKMSKTDSSIGTANNPVQVGDAIVTDEAAGTGHVACINSITTDPKTGKTMYTLTESNYKKNAKGQGIITNTRTLPADSSYIMGYARGPKSNSLVQSSALSVPQDNGMAWQVNSKLGDPVTTHIQNGTVLNVSQVGEMKNGDPMYMAQVKDLDTGTIYNFSGLSSSELRAGASWSNTQGIPQIGKASDSGYVQELRNWNNTPMAPTGKAAATPLTDAINAGQSWGKYDFIPGTTQVQSRFNRVITDLSKGTLSLESGLQQIKSDPILSQIKPEAYFGQLQDAASTGDLYKEQKQLQMDRTKQMTKSSKIMEVNRALQAIPTYQFDKTKGVIAQAGLAEVTKNRADAARTSGSDFELLDALTSFVNAGGKITEGQMQLLQANQTPYDKLEVLKEQATGNRVILSQGQREQLFNLIDENLQNTMSSYHDRMQQYQQYLNKNGIDFQLAELDPTSLSIQTSQGGMGTDASAYSTDQMSYYNNQLQPGEIMVRDNTTGEIGAIPSDEMDSSLYTVIQQ